MLCCWCRCSCRCFWDELNVMLSYSFWQVAVTFLSLLPEKEVEEEAEEEEEEERCRLISVEVSGEIKKNESRESTLCNNMDIDWEERSDCEWQSAWEDVEMEKEEEGANEDEEEEGKEKGKEETWSVFFRVTLSVIFSIACSAVSTSLSTPLWSFSLRFFLLFFNPFLESFDSNLTSSVYNTLRHGNWRENTWSKTRVTWSWSFPWITGSNTAGKRIGEGMRWDEMKWDGG